jgi:hypothetical protein
MKRLDKVGLDYLILMAKDIGFKTVCVSSKESENCDPEVTITFQGTREVGIPAPLHPFPSLSPPAVASATATAFPPGAIQGEAVPNKDKFSTLDDEPPPCSISKS